MTLSYVDAIVDEAAAWLAGLWGRHFASAFGVAMAGTLEAAKQATFQRFPLKAASDALEPLGQGFGLPIGDCKGLDESAYRTFLTKAHDTHRLARTLNGMLLALQRAGYESPWVYEEFNHGLVVDALGRHDVRNGWGKADPYDPTSIANYNRFWVVLDQNGAGVDEASGLWTDSAPWTDVELWTDGTTASFPFVVAPAAFWDDSAAWTDADDWVNPVPDEEIDRVFRVVKRFTPSAAQFVGVYWVLQGGVLGGHPSPEVGFPNANGAILGPTVIFMSNL